MQFEEYESVRVIKILDDPKRDVSINIRGPAVGDIGDIVYVYDAQNFMVQSYNSEGWTLWVADFKAEEIEKE